MVDHPPPILDYAQAQPRPLQQVLRVAIAVLIVLAAGVTGLVTGWHVQPARYYSDAMVQVGRSWEIDSAQGSSLALDREATERAKQAQLRAIDDDLLENALAQLPAGSAPSLREVRRGLLVQSIPDTKLIVIKYSDSDAQRSAMVVNAVVAQVEELDKQKLGELLGMPWTIGPSAVAAQAWPAATPRRAFWPAGLGASIAMSLAGVGLLLYWRRLSSTSIT
jgi:hypothetical protein